MIRIERVAEPPDFAKVRSKRLAEARQVIAKGDKIEFKDYAAVKRELAEMQHLKCCYCEKREETAENRDVDHYRPKVPYGWLAWTWENLLFACIDCNRQFKRNQFPLSPGDIKLVSEQAPPGSERPLVIDPSARQINPSEEIKFRPEKVQGNQRWRPTGLTKRGLETIRVCGLDRPGLLNSYTDHVNREIRPKVDELLKSIKTGQPSALYKLWSRTKRQLLRPYRPFQALSLDALDHLVKPDIRTHHNLPLP